ncbi:MAG TPA: AarF/ABC1/UbiB kinase family protein, partial [Vicinamibacteria bacterium]|nr:AarF/ABC1/UbiB kinase family protein [Vicinamibacteria bacterium]
LAQLLALRRDVFDEGFCAELSLLIDRGSELPFADVRLVVEAELGETIEEVFESFDEKCVAAASTGQTHRATLRGGAEVAVKVQRPRLEETVQRDLRDMDRFLARFGWVAIGVSLSWDDVRWEVEQALAENLDYRLETTYMMRSRKRLRRHRVLVPKVFTRYAHRRVQVKEWVSGMTMNAFMRARLESPEELQRWLTENEIDPEAVGKRIFVSMMRQIFEENYYHGYWHPGNLLLLRNGWVAIVDFWAMGSLESSFRRKYALFNQAIYDREYTKAADLLLLLCPALPPTAEPEAIRDRIVNALRTFEVRTFTRGLPFEEKSFSAGMGLVLHALSQERVPASWPVMRLDRAFAMIDRSLAWLMPDANLLKIGRQYWDKARKRAMARATSSSARTRSLSSFVTVLAEGPEFLSEQLLFQGEHARRGAKAFKRTTTKISDLLQVLSGLAAQATLAAGLLLFIVFLAQHHPSVIAGMRGSVTYVDAFPRIDYAVWVVGLLLILRAAVKLRALNRRFGRVESNSDGPT